MTNPIGFSLATLSLLAATAGSGLTQTAEPPKPSGVIAVDDSGAFNRADRDMQQVLEAHRKLDPKPLETLDPAEARRQPTPADAVAAVLKADGKNPDELKEQSGVKTLDETYPGAGGALPVRIYLPPGRTASTVFPVIVYFHGGGWVMADIDTYDASARALARRANAIVVSARYRQAPEHKFPAAHQDAFAAYKWVLDNAPRWGGDPKRVAVAGESAGGNLAINVAIMARDQKAQSPLHMLLVYPVAGIDMNTPSYQQNENARPLGKAEMQWFVKHAFAKEDDVKNPMIDLVGKANLRDLPDATVITANIDPLMTEGKLLADKLKAAGVEVKYSNVMGVTHEFFGMGAVVAAAAQAQEFAAQELKAALTEQTTGSTGKSEEKK